MKRLTVIIALALAACATTPRPVKVETVTVEKPVPVACIKRAAVPDAPQPAGPLSKDARQAADTLANVDLALRAYVRQLLALMSPCYD